MTLKLKLLCKTSYISVLQKEFVSQIFHELFIIGNPFMTACQMDVRDPISFLPEMLLNATAVYEVFSIY